MSYELLDSVVKGLRNGTIVLKAEAGLGHVTLAKKGRKNWVVACKSGP